MLKISLAPGHNGRKVLHVEGEIREAWVEVLEEECRRQIGSGSAHELALDLAHVTYVDTAGRVLMRNLTNMGIGLRNCPPIIAALLEDGGP